MPDEVFNKSSQAVGGAQRADAVTSFVAAGTNVGCGPESADKRKTEIYGTAMPPRRTWVVHTSNGDHDPEKIACTFGVSSTRHRARIMHKSEVRALAGCVAAPSPRVVPP